MQLAISTFRSSIFSNQTRFFHIPFTGTQRHIRTRTHENAVAASLTFFESGRRHRRHFRQVVFSKETFHYLSANTKCIFFLLFKVNGLQCEAICKEHLIVFEMRGFPLVLCPIGFFPPSFFPGFCFSLHCSQVCLYS